jgi:hypothetical protein
MLKSLYGCVLGRTIGHETRGRCHSARLLNLVNAMRQDWEASLMFESMDALSSKLAGAGYLCCETVQRRLVACWLPLLTACN